MNSPIYPKDYNTMMFLKKYLAISLALIPTQLCMIDIAHATIQTLTDNELSQQTGQAAFYTNYIAPDATGNADQLGFFTLGLQGSIALNANIQHLQLGCGGINGPGCDIDLNQVSLSGGAVGTDAVLNNPFIQLAIKNPNSLSTRQLVGFGLGAQSALGTLSVGTNPNPNTPGTVGGSPGGETGINTISGAFEAAAINLQIPVRITATGQANDPTVLGTAFAYLKQTATQPFTTGDKLTPDTSNTQTGTYYQFTSGSRLTGAVFGQTTLVIPQLNILGFAPTPILGLPLPLPILGQNLTNLTALATISPENLIDLHTLNLAGNPNAGLFLSLNSQSILYPQIGTKGIFTFPDTTQMLNPDGSLATRGYNSNGNPITIADLQAKPGWYLSAPQANIGNTDTFQQTGTVNLSAVGAVQALTTGVTVSSANLGQIPVINCYGGLKFC
jgi:hypothetical protein